MVGFRRKQRVEEPEGVIVLSEVEETSQTPEPSKPQRPRPSRKASGRPVKARGEISAVSIILWLFEAFYLGIQRFAGIFATMLFYLTLVVYFAVGLGKAVPGALSLLVFLTLMAQFVGLLVHVGKTKAEA